MKRIIAKLDIKGTNLVKGINLEGLRVLGEPDYFSKRYYEDFTDEIIYNDCVASLYDRKNLIDILKKSSSNIFIPISAGGGIRNLRDINKYLNSGADKVFINSAAIKKPKFLLEASKEFGSANICLSIETAKYGNNKDYYCFMNNGRDTSKKQVINWIKEAQQLGVGEIMLTSIEKEGMMNGFDIELIETISESVSVPLIIHGGASSCDDILRVLRYDKVSAVAISSLLHYSVLQKKDFKYLLKDEGNTMYLDLKRKKETFEKINILSIKKFLNENGIKVRL